MVLWLEGGRAVDWSSWQVGGEVAAFYPIGRAA